MAYSLSYSSNGFFCYIKILYHQQDFCKISVVKCNHCGKNNGKGSMTLLKKSSKSYTQKNLALA